MMNRLHQSQLKLKPLEWLVGHWLGEGENEGLILRGELNIDFRINDSFLVITEKLHDTQQLLVHEDCTWCFWQPSLQQIIAQQFMPLAQIEQRIIRIDETHKTMRWWTAPNAPLVHFELKDKTLHIRVLSPEKECWSHMQYQRTSCTT